MKKVYLKDIEYKFYTNIVIIFFHRKAAIKPDQVSNLTNEEKIPIYNSVSSCQNPITWGKFMEKNEMYGLEVPSINSIWYYMLILNRYLFVHNVCILLLHKIPAVIVDTIVYLSGRKPVYVSHIKVILIIT